MERDRLRQAGHNLPESDQEAEGEEEEDFLPEPLPENPSSVRTKANPFHCPFCKVWIPTVTLLKFYHRYWSFCTKISYCPWILHLTEFLSGYSYFLSTFIGNLKVAAFMCWGHIFQNISTFLSLEHLCPPHINSLASQRISVG